ncbi:MAG: hypothetical protein ACI4EG_04360 [Fusicatenibacter sp.]
MIPGYSGCGYVKIGQEEDVGHYEKRFADFEAQAAKLEGRKKK